MSGKLIVFEGTDGSGKATQAKLLCETLAQRGIAYREIDFPRYGNPFAEPANLYLHGALGNRPGDVNAYAASVLYAVDRFASYKEDWGGFYEEGGIVVANRYTTSNAVHQASKLPEGERREFLDWLFDLEYGRMGLPAPDLVLYLLLLLFGFWFPRRFSGPFEGVRWKLPLAGVLVLLLLMVLFTLSPPDHLLFVDLSGADTWSQLPC